MRPTLTRFTGRFLAFMKKLKTLFDFKVYKEYVLQISSIYDKKCSLNISQSRLFESKMRPNNQVWRNLLKIPERFTKKWKTTFDFNAFLLKHLLFSCVYEKNWALKCLSKLVVWFKDSLKLQLPCMKPIFLVLPSISEFNKGKLFPGVFLGTRFGALWLAQAQPENIDSVFFVLGFL